MRLNRNTLIVLAGSVIVIVLALLLLNSPASAPDNPEAEDDSGPLFPDVAAEDISQLRVVASATDDADAQASITLVRTDDGWQLEDVETDNAPDAARIESAVNNFASLRYERRFALEDDALATFGLDAPDFTLSATAEDASLQVRIGNQLPTGARYYALLGDDDATIYIVAPISAVNTLTGFINNPPVILPPTPTPQPVLSANSPVFADFDAQALTRFSVRDVANDADTTLIRDPESNAWQIEAATNSQAAPTDDTAASIEISSLAFAEPISVSRVEDLAALGLDDPAFTIVAEDADGTSYRLQIGQLDPTGARYYTLVNDFEQVAEISRASLAPLLNWVEQPPYAPAPIAPAEATPEATAEATAETTPEDTP